MTTYSRRRVVITGMGTVNPCGLTVQETWDNLLAGKSGIGLVDRFDVSEYACKIAGQVKGFDPDKFVDKKEQKKMDIFISYAMGAADEAWKDAGFDGVELSKDERERFGTYIGSGIGGLNTIWEERQRVPRAPPHQPLLHPLADRNMASGFASIKYGLKGPNSAVATACATGTHAIGDAARLIALGYADAHDGGRRRQRHQPAGPGRLRRHARALHPQRRAREGQPPLRQGPRRLRHGRRRRHRGPGGYEMAKARGAKIYAEVAGYGMSGDAHHITSPAPRRRGRPARACAPRSRTRASRRSRSAM